MHKNKFLLGFNTYFFNLNSQLITKKNHPMKQILTLLFSFFIFFNGISQVNLKLDEKNGFKDFQIGDSYEKWKLNLVKISGEKDRIIYRYNGECCQQVFNYEVEEILLEFRSNKLINISITLEQWEKSTGPNDFTDLKTCFENIDDLAEKFDALFGPHADYSKNENTGIISYGWYGNKIALSCSMQYQGIRAGCKPIILLGDMTSTEKGF